MLVVSPLLSELFSFGPLIHKVSEAEPGSVNATRKATSMPQCIKLFSDFFLPWKGLLMKYW